MHSDSRRIRDKIAIAYRTERLEREPDGVPVGPFFARDEYAGSAQPKYDEEEHRDAEFSPELLLFLPGDLLFERSIRGLDGVG